MNLNERAKSIKIHAGLPKTFSAEAVSTITYPINRGPSVPIRLNIPEEEWQGKDASLSHLKVFSVFLIFVLEILTGTSLIHKQESAFSLTMEQII